MKPLFFEPASPATVLKLPDRTFWTEERFERAKQLFSEGLSYTQVATELGTTRNAICGKMTRAGLYRGERKRVAGVRTYRKRPGGYAMRAQAIERRKEIWSCGGAELTDLPADTPDDPARLMELHDDQCHWPCSGVGAATLFCGGEAISGLSYCARHSRIAYMAPRR